MFSRGQRFVVIESSAKKRQHPTVGDCGYLRNACLYRDGTTGHLFTIVDAYFSKFTKDPDGRCEKKRFALSNNLSAFSKCRLQGGISSLQLGYVASSLILDDVLRNLRRGRPIIEHDALFPKGMSKGKTPLVFKFTVCRIAPAFPTEIHQNKWERKAWVQSVRPTLVLFHEILANTKLPKKVAETISDMTNRFYRYSITKNRHGTDFEGPERSIVPDTFRIIQNFHFLQSFIVSVIKSMTIPDVNVQKRLLELRRRYNDYNAALDRISDEF